MGTENETTAEDIRVSIDRRQARRHGSCRSALYALVAVTVLLVARDALVAERSEKAHAIVESVWSMADMYQRAAEAGKMTSEEAKGRFSARLAAFGSRATPITFSSTTPKGALCRRHRQPRTCRQGCVWAAEFEWSGLRIHNARHRDAPERGDDPVRIA